MRESPQLSRVRYLSGEPLGPGWWQTADGRFILRRTRRGGGGKRNKWMLDSEQEQPRRILREAGLDRSHFKTRREALARLQDHLQLTEGRDE